jgi:hypothetical protein
MKKLIVALIAAVIALGFGVVSSVGASNSNNANPITSFTQSQALKSSLMLLAVTKTPAPKCTPNCPKPTTAVPK